MLLAEAMQQLSLELDILQKIRPRTALLLAAAALLVALALAFLLAGKEAEKPAAKAHLLHPRHGEQIVDPAFCTEEVRKLEAQGVIMATPTPTEFTVDEQKWAGMQAPKQRMIGAIARCMVVKGYLFNDRTGDLAILKGNQSGKTLAVATIVGVYIP